MELILIMFNATLLAATCYFLYKFASILLEFKNGETLIEEMDKTIDNLTKKIAILEFEYEMNKSKTPTRKK